jgi:hypothetical protein
LEIERQRFVVEIKIVFIVPEEQLNMKEEGALCRKRKSGQRVFGSC